MNIKYVSWSSSDENSEKQELEREKHLSEFPGKINIEVDFFMQYVYNHSLEITHVLKSRYSNDQQKLYRIHNSKTTKKYFNEIALMKREHLDKWIGTAACQKILEALENNIIHKKHFRRYTAQKILQRKILDVGSISNNIMDVFG